MKKIDLLKKKYPRFVYNNYSYKINGKDLEISFDFSIEPGIHFSPSLIIKNIDKLRINHLNKKVLNNLIFHLGLIETLSYWKTTCSPIIEIRGGELNQKQIKWWKDLIINGMGQFFYENRIDWRKPDFLKIKSKNSSKNNFKQYQYPENLKNRVLVAVGGGKDSVVSLEVLKKTRKRINCFSLNPTIQARKITKIAGCQKPIIIERKIDKKLLELNREGFLNGHTPFSAYLAFLSILLGVIFDYRYLVFSNEGISNEGNLRYLGKIINHQYSKSFEFEEKFRDYSQQYLTPQVKYFSFLRPLYEIQITKLFSKYPKYFTVFLSCNEAFKTYSGREKPTGKWCGNCSKCLFVYACLYPFLNKFQLRKIFKENFFRKIKLISLMEQLAEEGESKPFECVGTKKESLVAFYLSWKKTHRREEIPFLLKHFEKKILVKYPNLEEESRKIMNSWNNQHNLPKDFKKILKRIIDKK